MKSITLYLSGTILSIAAIGQNKFSPALDSLVHSEIAFAKVAREISLRTAFLQFMSPEGLRFQNGDPVNAIKLMEHSPEPIEKEILDWEPVFADISSEQDFGYSTGPWVFYNTTKDTVPAATGYYSTVWAKQADGKWKILADLGIGFKDAHKNKPALYTSSIKLPNNKITINKQKVLTDLLTLDKKYLEELNKSNHSFISSYFSTEGRIHRQREAPYIGTVSIITIKEDDKKFWFEQSGGSIATSGDMGYSYGRVKVELTVNGSIRKINANYIRVWKKENGKDWKIVLDVIGSS